MSAGEGSIVDPRVEVLSVQYAVYRWPADYPNKYVVRKWLILRGYSDAVPSASWTADTLETARLPLPYGLHRLERFADDDPVIVEVWI